MIIRRLGLVVLILLKQCLGDASIQGNEDEIEPVDLVPFKRGQPLYIECIRRHIDNGEHMFGENDEILYSAFPNCTETGKPFEIPFRTNTKKPLKCSIPLQDEFYHLMQLYVHQDVPFTCRISSSANYLDQIPLVFTMRGRAQESHIDIDPDFNLIIHQSNGIPISGVAYSRGVHKPIRAKIGDTLTFSFNIKWLPIDLSTPSKHFGAVTLFFCFAASIITFAITASYYSTKVFPKRLKRFNWTNNSRDPVLPVSVPKRD